MSASILILRPLSGLLCYWYYYFQVKTNPLDIPINTDSKHCP